MSGIMLGCVRSSGRRPKVSPRPIDSPTSSARARAETVAPHAPVAKSCEADTAVVLEPDSLAPLTKPLRSRMKARLTT
jgi:hypothetical protein